MENDIANPSFEATPMTGEDGGVLGCTIVGCLQLLVQGDGCENDLLSAGRELGRVSIECGLQFHKPVIVLATVLLYRSLEISDREILIPL